VRRAGQLRRLAGVVVKRRPNVERDEFDALKAIVHHCARLGGASQNCDAHRDLRAHVLGRIAWVSRVNAERGRRLMAEISTPSTVAPAGGDLT
jgi:RNA-directed DNA polymerase